MLKDGYIDRFAGTGEGTHEFGHDTGDEHRALDAGLGECHGLAVAGDGTVYLAQERPDRVRKVDPQGIIHAFAGTGEQGYSGDNGPAVSARLHWPLGIALDGKGSNLYIADTGNHCVRKVDSGGTVTRYVGTTKLGSAGVPGPPEQAELNQPCGLAIDQAGNLFIADTRNWRILKVDPQGQQVTLHKELPFQPLWIAADGAGNLYVIDQEHQKTLSVVSAKDLKVTVIEDGTRNFYMTGLASDNDGNLFVSYFGEGVTRGVFMLSAPDRKISVVAGFGSGRGSVGDGGPAVAAGLVWPAGLALSSTGDLYVWDEFRVRVIKKARDAAKVRPVVVSVSGPAPKPIPGGSTTKGPLFVWDVQRADGGPLEGTTVTVTLPAEVEEVSFTPAGGTLDPGKKKITWTLTGKDTKQHFELTANVTPPDDATSVSVHVTAQHGNETLDDRDISIPVEPKADPSHKPVLAIPTWKVFPAQAGRGSHVAFAWKITNQGQATAKDVKAAVTLPKGLTPVGEYKDAAGVWDEGKRTVTSSQGGSLKAGAYWWITVVARVDDDAPAGDLEAKVAVSATGA
ncbi:SMP-30/gluconolactonase/LRE family protein, partial [Streptomyces lavenduligriseus]